MLINRLIKEAVDHGGDAGGPYFVNGDALFEVMLMYKEKIFGENSGIVVCMKGYDYPHFVLDLNNKNLEKKKIMSEAKQRVIDEREQLHEKIIKLNDFVDWNEKFKELPKEQQRLLKLQLRAMIMYREILDDRLDIWEDGKEKE